MCGCFNEVNSLLWLHWKEKEKEKIEMDRNTGASRNVSEHNNITQNCYTVLIGGCTTVVGFANVWGWGRDFESFSRVLFETLSKLQGNKIKLGLVRHLPIKVVVQLTNNIYTYYIICQFSSTCLPENYTLKPLHNLKKTSNETLEFKYYMKTFKLNVQIAYNLKIKSYKWPENKIIKSKNVYQSIN